MLSFIQTVPNLENQHWIPQYGANINNPAMDSITATLIPGGVLKVTGKGSKPMAGALVTCKPTTILINNTYENSYFGLDLDLYVPSSELAKIARIELDVKRVVTAAKNKVKIAQVADGSTQLNTQTGIWEIDKAGGSWVPTEFQPLLPPCWTHINFRYFMDSSKYSVLSTNWGGMLFIVPSSMKALPLLVDDWDAVVAVQVQFELLGAGEATIYLRNINLSVSNSPF